MNTFIEETIDYEIIKQHKVRTYYSKSKGKYYKISKIIKKNNDVIFIRTNKPLHYFMDIISKPNIYKIVFSDIFDQPIENVPPNIKCIDIGGTNGNDNYTGLKYNHELSNLPITLKQFSIFLKIDCSLDYLPEGLKSLTIHECNEIYLDNLPHSLENLYIVDARKLTKPLLNLPLNLKGLSFYYGYKFPVSTLPRTLKLLNLGNQAGSLENLPPNLEVLSIFDRFFDYETYLYPYVLPASIKLFQCYSESNICRYIKEKYGSQITIFFEDEDYYW
jgi:hypothetical protein